MQQRDDDESMFETGDQDYEPSEVFVKCCKKYTLSVTKLTAAVY